MMLLPFKYGGGVFIYKFYKDTKNYGVTAAYFITKKEKWRE